MSTIIAWFRLARAGWVMAREGVIAALPGEQLYGMPKLGWRIASLLARRGSTGSSRDLSLSRAVDRLGPSYVKLGQFLATRPDVVGAAIATELAKLQDKMSTFPTAEAVSAIE